MNDADTPQPESPQLTDIAEVTPERKPRKPKPKPKPELPTGDAELVTRHDRMWLEVSAADVAKLDAVDGDAIIVGLDLEIDEGPVERLSLVGIFTTAKHSRRIWLTEFIDVDRVASVTLKRRRLA